MLVVSQTQQTYTQRGPPPVCRVVQVPRHTHAVRPGGPQQQHYLGILPIHEYKGSTLDASLRLCYVSKWRTAPRPKTDTKVNSNTSEVNMVYSGVFGVQAHRRASWRVLMD